VSRFRRGRGGSGGQEPGADSDAGPGDDLTGIDDDADLTEDGQDVAADEEDFDRGGGPWDVEEVEGQGERLDLGGIWLPHADQLEVRLDMDEQSGLVTAATVVLGGSAVQLQAFAAPRSAGIWDEIREEIAAGITRQGGTADTVRGMFGRELLAQIPVRSPDGRATLQTTRFIGVDGPRWFLRAVVHGPAAYQPEAAQPLEDLVRGVVVVRGADAMAPRDLLPLRLPEQARQALAPGAEEPAEEAPQREPLRPFERGPEITEVR
jgi:hypothetical protein